MHVHTSTRTQTARVRKEHARVRKEHARVRKEQSLMLHRFRNNRTVHVDGKHFFHVQTHKVSAFIGGGLNVLLHKPCHMKTLNPANQAQPSSQKLL